MRSGKVSQLSPDARLHQLVCAIADTLGTVDSDKPAVGDSDAFGNYCKVVNGELFRHNNRHSHVFGLWEQYTCEPEEVKQALLEKLPALRVFECGDPKRASTVLRADSDLLETWYAGHLRTIEARRKLLATTPISPPRDTLANQKAESTPMITINAGNGNINVATGHAHAQQNNLMTLDAELLGLLNELLAVTNIAESRYAELRKACRTAQGELEETEALTAPTRTWLNKTIDALPTADRALDVAHKVADLLSRVPGLGAWATHRAMSRWPSGSRTSPTGSAMC